MNSAKPTTARRPGHGPGRRRPTASLTILAVLVLALVLGGCDSILPQSSPSTAVPGPNAVRQLILEQLRDKYDEDFECTYLSYATWPFNPTTYKMSARRAGDPDRTVFTAMWDPRYDDPMTDHYLDVKMAHLFTDAAQDRVDAVFPLNITRISLSTGRKTYDLPPGINEADYQVWAADNAGLEIDVLIPVEPGVTRDDIAALLPEIKDSPAELGVLGVRLIVTAYTLDNYYELARLHAKNEYVFDNNYGGTIKIEFALA
jgi:hypothetical protein